MMRSKKLILALLLALPAAGTLGTAATATTTHGIASAPAGTAPGVVASAGAAGPIVQLVQAYLGTALFNYLPLAEKAGYGEFRDAAGIACIEEPGMGGMGVHYVNGAFVGATLDDTVLDPARPEALVYEPTRNGRLRLVALEYIVGQAAWDATHTQPPTLFGQEFHLTPSPNRFGLPAFYQRHAWIWKQNPSGLFADYNPRVDC